MKFANEISKNWGFLLEIVEKFYLNFILPMAHGRDTKKKGISLSFPQMEGKGNGMGLARYRLERKDNIRS